MRARATAGVPLSHKFGSTASLLHHVLDLHHLLDASGWQHRLEYGLVVCSQKKQCALRERSSGRCDALVGTLAHVVEFARCCGCSQPRLASSAYAIVAPPAASRAARTNTAMIDPARAVERSRRTTSEERSANRRTCFCSCRFFWYCSRICILSGGIVSASCVSRRVHEGGRLSRAVSERQQSPTPNRFSRKCAAGGLSPWA